MLLLFRKNKAQSTAEYAIVIGIVVAAAIAMQTYVKRGLQAGIKFAVDKAGSTATTAKNQYEPYYLQSTYTTEQTSGSTQSEELDATGKIIRGTDSGTKSRTGSQTTTSTTGAD